ncbi:MAG: hypothetical protein RMJ66_03750 [Bacteroidia bacterium]|nr:hypothetical protein [Bacteroidia bacterium]
MKSWVKVGLYGLSAVALYAQKPSAGTVTTEAGVSGIFNVNLIQGTTRFRYFLADRLALRLGLGFASGGETRKAYENPDGTGGTAELKGRYSNFQIYPGAEFHFGGAEKLSTFAGAYFLVGIGSARTEAINVDINDYLGGGDVSYRANTKLVIDGSYANFQKGTTIGVGLYTGFDWYITEKLYVGGEWGFLFQNTNYADVKVEQSSGGVTLKLVRAGSRISSTDIQAVGALRLGYQF